MSPGRALGKTGVELSLSVVSELLRSKASLYPVVGLVDDVGGDFPKMMQERKRNLEKEAKVLAAGLSPQRGPRPVFELDAVMGDWPKGYLAELYADRSPSGGRRQWQAALGELVRSPQYREKLDDAIGGSGAVTFSGVGASEKERQRTVTLRCVPGGSGRTVTEESAPSAQREETPLMNQAARTLQGGGNVVIETVETDRLLLCILSVDKLQHPGQLFLRMTSQKVNDGSGSLFEEEYVCCNDYARAIRRHPSLSCIELEQMRVPSVVALFTLLGCDTTSYLYLPFIKALGWYLAHADYVGALVQTPTAQEEAEGWPFVLDEEAVKRCFKLLYSCRNVGAIDKWTSLPLPERFAALRSIRYEDLEKKVARCVFPLTMLFMPNWELALQHMLRAQHRLCIWHNADLDAPVHVPLVGFVVVFKRTAACAAMGDSAAADGGEVRLGAPTEAAVASKCAGGFEVERVEPNVAMVNTPLAELFGGEVPRDVLLRGTRPRGLRSVEKASAEKMKRAPLLAAARKKLSKAAPQPRVLVAEMLAVAVAFKVNCGGSARELTALRASMKGPGNAAKVFAALVVSVSGTGFPWKEMGAPDEAPRGLGAEEAEDPADTEGEGADEAREDVDDDGAYSDGDSDDGDGDDDGAAEDEDEEDLALGCLLESVVTAVGDGADAILDEIDDAPSNDDVRLAVAEMVSRRTRRPTVRMDL